MERKKTEKTIQGVLCDFPEWPVEIFGRLTAIRAKITAKLIITIRTGCYVGIILHF